MAERNLVVVPTYNEADNLERLVGLLRATLPASDVLVVDDSSPDGTGELADRLAAADPQVHVLHRPGKLGLGTAHMDAMDWGLARGYATLATMDCDFTHRPEDVAELLRLREETGADLAVGTRYSARSGVADWPVWRQAITHTAHLATRVLLGMPYDATNALRVYRTEALRRVPYRTMKGEGYSFMFELLHLCHRAGLRIVELPVVMPYRQDGVSKISRREVVRSLRALGRLSVGRLGRRLRGPGA